MHFLGMNTLDQNPETGTLPPPHVIYPVSYQVLFCFSFQTFPTLILYFPFKLSYSIFFSFSNSYQ